MHSMHGAAMVNRLCIKHSYKYSIISIILLNSTKKRNVFYVTY